MKITSIFNPSTEGIDHINVYSQSQTDLGKMLSNFYRTRFDTLDGQFKSIEAYKYYLLTYKRFDCLRQLFGYSARAVGQDLIKASEMEADFEIILEDLELAVESKIKSNPVLKSLLKNTDLPLTSYYVFEKGEVVVDKTNENQWLIDAILKTKSKL